MASWVRLGACAALLAAPTVLAFFSGGFFDQPRLWAGVLAWVLAAAVALFAPRPLPRSAAGRVAVGALAGLLAWMALSLTWSPLLDPGLADVERVALYLAVLICAAALLRPPVSRAVEPALAAGAVIVCGYALVARLLPTLIHTSSSVSAGPRLEQPITYWNALGALAAIGAVLALRLASDGYRSPRTRVLAAAGVPVFALALYLTISRGALAAAGAGVLALLLIARDRRTVASVIVGAVSGGLVSALTTRFPGVDQLDADLAGRRNQGLAVLALLLIAAAGAAAAQAWLVRLERDGRDWTDVLRARRTAAAALVAIVVAVALAAGLAPHVSGGAPATPVVRVSGTPGAQLPTGPQRLKTLETNRWRYWRVAVDGFADAPLRGDGIHGFAALWLEHRTIGESAQDAHSVYLETLAELGLVGFLLLALFLAATLAAALEPRRRGPGGRALTTGWLAAGVVFLVHAGVDWDWEMPALALIFVLLAGAAIGAADAEAESDYAVTGSASRSSLPDAIRGRLSRRQAASSATAPSTTSAGSAANRNRVTP